MAPQMLVPPKTSVLDAFFLPSDVKIGFLESRLELEDIILL